MINLMGYASNLMTLDPDDFICTAVNREWADKIADAIVSRYGVGVVLVENGKKLEPDI